MSTVIAYGVCVPISKLVNGTKRVELAEMAGELDGWFLDFKSRDLANGVPYLGNSWDEARAQVANENGEYTEFDLLDSLTLLPESMDELFGSFFDDYAGVTCSANFPTSNGEQGLLVYIDNTYETKFSPRDSQSASPHASDKQELQKALDYFGIEDSATWVSF